MARLLFRPRMQMPEHSCCRGIPTQTGSDWKGPWLLSTPTWILPTAVLASLPQCAMCVAADMALATGLTVSLSVATWIRSGLLVICLGTLTVLSVQVLARAFDRRNGRSQETEVSLDEVPPAGSRDKSLGSRAP